MMLDVLILCEGQTEREFCKRVVATGLHAFEVSVAGTLVGKPHRKRGGISAWPVYRKEIVRLAKERNDRYVGVLVDYYAMPNSWPGRSEAPGKLPADRGLHIEETLRADLQGELGDRFVPCVQLHEFETLLFVAPEATARCLSSQASDMDENWIKDKIAKVLTDFGGSAELINDDPTTAPSKRLKSILPRYDKVAWGFLATSEAGLNVLREGCPWLDRWLTELESLGEK